MASGSKKSAAKKAAPKASADCKDAYARRKANALENRCDRLEAVNTALAGLVAAQLSTMPSAQRDEAQALIDAIAA